MINIATTQLWVDDQDAALEFWTKKVGFYLSSNIRLGWPRMPTASFGW